MSKSFCHFYFFSICCFLLCFLNNNYSVHADEEGMKTRLLENHAKLRNFILKQFPINGTANDFDDFYNSTTNSSTTTSNNNNNNNNNNANGNHQGILNLTIYNTFLTLNAKSLYLSAICSLIYNESKLNSWGRASSSSSSSSDELFSSLDYIDVNDAEIYKLNMKWTTAILGDINDLATHEKYDDRTALRFYQNSKIQVTFSLSVKTDCFSYVDYKSSSIPSLSCPIWLISPIQVSQFNSTNFDATNQNGKSNSLWQHKRTYTHSHSLSDTKNIIFIYLIYQQNQSDIDISFMKKLPLFFGIFIIGQYLLLLRGSTRILLNLFLLIGELYWLHGMEELPIFQWSNQWPIALKMINLHTSIIGLQCLAIVIALVLQFINETQAWNVPDFVKKIVFYFNYFICCQKWRENNLKENEIVQTDDYCDRMNALNNYYQGEEEEDAIAAAEGGRGRGGGGQQYVNDDLAANFNNNPSRLEVNAIIISNQSIHKLPNSFFTFALLSLFLDRLLAIVNVFLLVILFLVYK